MGGNLADSVSIVVDLLTHLVYHLKNVRNVGHSADVESLITNRSSREEINAAEPSCFLLWKTTLGEKVVRGGLFSNIDSRLT